MWTLKINNMIYFHMFFSYLITKFLILECLYWDCEIVSVATAE